MPNLYIISGCNGAGKTTASFTILPEILNCKEFVNADNIAAGISPFNPESVAIEANKVMITYVDGLIKKEADFVLETNLLTNTYKTIIKAAQKKGYKVMLFHSSYTNLKTNNDKAYPRQAENSFNQTDFASKVLEGITKANRKMIERAALNDRDLIIGDDKGGFKAVPAKELLAKLPK